MRKQFNSKARSFNWHMRQQFNNKDVKNSKLKEDYFDTEYWNKYLPHYKGSLWNDI
jgi:hypothetical protein